MSQIKTKFIEDNAVTTAKINNSAVDANKIATDAVTTAKIQNSAVDANKIATDAVTTAKIQNSAVDANKLATDAVTTAKIQNSAVDSTKLASNAVTSSAIAANAVTGAKVRLDNNEALRARNAANSADLNLLKADASDKTVIIAEGTEYVLPGTDGSSGDVLQTDGGGNLSWTTPAAAGANTALSNLASTAVNADILPDGDNTRSLGAAAFNWFQIVTGGLYSSELPLSIGSVSSGNARNVEVVSNIVGGSASSGNTTIASGDASAFSGDVILKVGSAATPGSLKIQDPSLGSASVGYVWELQNTTTGEGAWAAAAASGANTSLSNLTSPTAINQDLIFDQGGPAAVQTKNGTASEDLTVKSGNASSSDTGALNLRTGDAQQTSGNIEIKTGDQLTAGGYNSGSIILQTGSADPSGTQGVIYMREQSLGAASNGYVWTLTDQASGRGEWQAAAGGATSKKELFVLSGTNITNQYIDLAEVAQTDSIDFLVKGGGVMIEGASYDYSVSYTGGAGGKTRITFLNDLATGGASALVATDVVVVKYTY